MDHHCPVFKDRVQPRASDGRFGEPIEWLGDENHGQSGDGDGRADDAAAA